MNRAIWKKAFSDAWVQLAVSSLLLLLFGWLFVWLTSLFKLGLWANFLNMLPDFVQQLMGVPLADLATLQGRLSFLYTHVITLLLFIGWSVGRGSDAVSGGIANGTLELVLTLPVRRVTVLAVPSVVATLGAAVLAASLWLGTLAGLSTVTLESDVSIWAFLPGAVNLFAMAFCLAGVATLLSSCDHDRWRTIWVSGGFFVVSAIIKMVARLWESGAWLKYLSFLTAFEPQQLILRREGVWSASLWHNGPLLVLGLIAYVAATFVFCRRDIPVPR
jgi:ABC-2 type transport system permease protein